MPLRAGQHRSCQPSRGRLSLTCTPAPISPGSSGGQRPTPPASVLGAPHPPGDGEGDDAVEHASERNGPEHAARGAEDWRALRQRGRVRIAVPARMQVSTSEAGETPCPPMSSRVPKVSVRQPRQSSNPRKARRGWRRARSALPSESVTRNSAGSGPKRQPQVGGEAIAETALGS